MITALFYLASSGLFRPVVITSLLLLSWLAILFICIVLLYVGSNRKVYCFNKNEWNGGWADCDVGFVEVLWESQDNFLEVYEQWRLSNYISLLKSFGKIILGQVVNT